MIRQLAILAVAAVCLTASTTAVDLSGEEGRPKFNKFVSFFSQTGPADPEWQQTEFCGVGVPITASVPEYKTALVEFCEKYNNGMLPRGRLFSPFYPSQIAEIKLLFKVLYYAPLNGAFFDFAYWAYFNVNEHLFGYVFRTILIHRFQLSPIFFEKPYMNYPEYYFNTDVIKKFYDIRTNITNIAESENRKYVVHGNYSGWYTSYGQHYEHRLNYFTEDIDFNSWYFLLNMRYPSWLSTTEYPEMKIKKRGSVYAYIHTMLLHRLNMERLSHNMPKVEVPDWHRPISTGYYPSMIHKNGLHFPTRPEWTDVQAFKNKFVEKLDEFDSRVTAAIDLGYAFDVNATLESIRGENGFDILADIVQGNGDSLNDKFYGSFDTYARHIFGFAPEPHNESYVLPSALELYSTSMRDPAFFSIYTKIAEFFYRYKERLGPYTKEELICEDVEIKSARITNELTTFFEPKETLAQIFPTPHGYSEIYVRQERLNHDVFTFKIDINSKTNGKFVIRIFMGPKYNIYGKEIAHKYKHFLEIDYFAVDLKTGDNTVVRSSNESSWISPSHSNRGSFAKGLGAEQTSDFFRYQYGFPEHMLLPVGRTGGFPVEFFFYVSKYEAEHVEVGPYFTFWDNKPLGFPMDRPEPSFGLLPNMFKIDDVKIYHKERKSGSNLTTQ